MAENRTPEEEKDIHAENETDQHTETHQPAPEETPSGDINTAATETTADDTAAQDDALKQMQEDLSLAKDKYLRLYAEFENYRKRTAKERLELTKTANEELILDLLTVIDDLERSLQIFKDKEEVAPMYEGIQLVNQKFNKVLTQKGLKAMEIEPGSDFDSEYHEAVAQIPAPEEKFKGKIVDVIEKGYFLGDKVLRYAKVVTGQ